ncbi:MAG: TrkH family potassium uptake protein, partial [Anaerovoracaceae bacterium]
VDTADAFSNFGQVIIAVLIQAGGLGISSMGAMLILLRRGRISLMGGGLVREGLNLYSSYGLKRLVRAIIVFTLLFEVIGTVLALITFYPQFGMVKGLGVSAFHSIASFNNAGFDVFGGFRSMTEYSDNLLMNINTAILIIIGGIGYAVMNDIAEKRSLRKLTLHSKAVLLTTALLLVFGTLLFVLTSDMNFLEAFFQSTSARTAGFASVSIVELPKTALLILIFLMFVGASPGSTGGGVKTTTFFTMVTAITCQARNQKTQAFKRMIPDTVVARAFFLSTLALALVFTSTFIVCLLEKDMQLIEILFEVVSAFGTVGLSMGITPDLSAASKLVIIITMFIGRVGPLTMLTVWFAQQQKSAHYSKEGISLG